MVESQKSNQNLPLQPTNFQLVYYYVLETNLRTAAKDIEFLRRKIAPMEGAKDDIWHNHDLEDGKTIHRYPSVQYKILNRRFAIVALPYAENTLFELIKKMPFEPRKGMKMDMTRLQKFPLGIDFSEVLITYSCNNWMPMDSELFQIYKEMCEQLQEPPSAAYIQHPILIRFFTELLKEQIMKNAFALGVLIAPEYLDIQITTDRIRHSLVNARRMKFSKLSELTFEMNLHWPTHLGIGKATAIGFGMLKKLKT